MRFFFMILTLSQHSLWTFYRAIPSVATLLPSGRTSQFDQPTIVARKGRSFYVVNDTFGGGGGEGGTVK